MKRAIEAPCKFDTCDNPARAKGYCAGHVQQLYNKQPFSCLRSNKTRWYPRYPGGTKERLLHIKMERGCKDCGYNAHPEALEFDHLPGHTKSFNLSRPKGSWEAVVRELEKCEVVCANCHRVRTFNRRHGYGA